ncbi:hypothetical protein ACFL59_11515 [Planctomycetota bacterium]
MPEQRRQRTYDHRLRQLVRKTGDLRIAMGLGVPRSTAMGWLRSESQEVVSADVLDMREVGLQAEVLRLRQRVRVLGTVVGLLLALVRVSGFKLDGRRFLEYSARTGLLRAVERARKVLPLQAVPRVLGLSPSRFHARKGAAAACRPLGGTGCPQSAPNQLTPEERGAMSRALRVEFTGVQYHVMFRGVARRQTFIENDDSRRFLADTVHLSRWGCFSMSPFWAPPRS